MAQKSRRYSREMLAKAAEESISVSGVMRKLGFTFIAGGSHTHISKKLKEFEVDTSHFLGQGHHKGNRCPTRKSPAEILILRTDGQRAKRPQLHRALIEIGVPYVCACCGQDPEWEEKPLTLPVDHIDGNPLDDRKENLRFLCPNCHTQTETFGNT